LIVSSSLQLQSVDSVPAPQLHWAIVLILTCVTGGLFGAIWLIVQASWVRKLRRSDVAFWLAVANAVVVGIGAADELIVRMKWHTALTGDNFADLTLVLWIAAVYTLRYELERPPIEMSLSYWLPFLLGPVYFQYRLADYARGVDGKRATGSLLGL
jgi:hypothetical protein